MYLTVKDWQVNYTTITNGIPNYPANSTILLNTIPQIQTISEQQKISKEGLVDNKNQLKDALIVVAADNARKLGVFAKFTNNAVLAKEINISESKFKKAADTAVKDLAQIVYDRAQTNVAALATYGITAATQTSFLAAITAYNNSIGKPAAGKAEMTQLTKQLVVLFDTADSALANMDAGVEIVRLSQPNFYNGYKNARKVVVTGTGSLSVNGLVSDAETGEPIKGVTVTFSLDGGAPMAKSAKQSGSATTVVTKKTAEKGGLKIKSMTAGRYTVTLKKVGFADVQTTIDVNDGEMSDFNIGLTKI